MKRLKHVHTKIVKGKEYCYFDTGQQDDRGKKVFLALGSSRDPGFPRAYAAACDQRHKRKVVNHVRTFDWLLGIYEKSPEFRGLAENTKKSYRNSLNKATKLLRGGDGKSAPLEGIAAADILRIRDTLVDGQGANQAVRALSALFTWASKPERNYMPSNPAYKIGLFDEGEHEPWKEWLVEEALTDDAMRPFVGLFYFTGQRIGEIIRMQWTDIKDGHIYVRQRKTGIELEIPISAELSQILGELPRRGFTILTQANGKAWPDNTLRLAMQKWALERGQEIVPHGLRKNAVNALLEAECSTAEVSAITGQSLKMVEHYAKKRNQKALGGSAIVKFDKARQSRGKKRT